MTILTIVRAPHTIFSQQALPVTTVDADVMQHLHDMLETLYHHRAIGLGANMVGLLQRLIVVDLQENQEKKPYLMANPEISWQSDTTHVGMEASLSFPGIKAQVRRFDAITVTYLHVHNEKKTFKAQGLLARVIQHELDYLNGITFLDRVSRTRKKILLQQLKRP